MKWGTIIIGIILCIIGSLGLYFLFHNIYFMFLGGLFTLFICFIHPFNQKEAIKHGLLSGLIAGIIIGILFGGLDVTLLFAFTLMLSGAVGGLLGWWVGHESYPTHSKTT